MSLSALKAPTQQSITRGYRALLRALNQNLTHSVRSESVKAAPTQWKRMLARKYRENQALPLDSPQVAKLQRSVLDMTVMLTSNLDHEKALREGGWGVARTDKEHLATVARFCGLEMPTVLNDRLDGKLGTDPNAISSVEASSASAKA